MKAELLAPGTEITYHGGYDSTAKTCPICLWPCTFQYKGVILGNLIQNGELQDDQWTARLETGSCASGYEEQFDTTAYAILLQRESREALEHTIAAASNFQSKKTLREIAARTLEIMRTPADSI